MNSKKTNHPNQKIKKVKEKGDKWKNKQSLTLSEFFARKEEETSYKINGSDCSKR